MLYQQKTLPQKAMKQATMHTGRHAQTTHTSQRDAFTAYLPSLHLSATPSQNGGVVSNGDHTQDPSRPSHSPTLETDSGEKDPDLASNGGPPTFKSEDTPPRGCPEGQGPRSPVATSVREELPPVKPPRKKATS